MTTIYKEETYVVLRTVESQKLNDKREEPGRKEPLKFSNCGRIIIVESRLL